MTVLESYHELERVQLPQGAIHIKPGMRGYPDTPPAEPVFRRLLAASTGPLLDATGTAGAVALAAAAAGGTGVTVHEPSMAALRCATRTLDGVAEVRAALPWDLQPGTVERLALAPPADRGNSRLLAELLAAASALRQDGILYVALHKDGGARRFEKRLEELFESVEVRVRDKGWRLSVAQGVRTVEGAAESEGVSHWTEFEAAGLPLESLPGVHASGRLDPGTRLLVENTPWKDLAGRRVLDLGCGYGVLALLAAKHGGAVTAVDDDLAAVESVKRNAARLGLEVDARHSDVDSALGDETFEVILCNPPFHVGRGVRLDVPRAFIAAAARLLTPAGELWLVANRDLPYEREIGSWARPDTVANERGFKVIRAVRAPR